MDASTFQLLLDLESSFIKAQELISDDQQTDLLIQHLEIISNHSSNTVSKHEIEQLLHASGPFNLSLTCSQCHQSIYENDTLLEKQDLQPCCHNTLNSSITPIEVSFWWFLINNYSSCILTLPNYTRFILKNGIPPSLRDRVWGILTHSCDSQGEIDPYMSTLYDSLNKDISPDIRIITKDVNRTYPELSMFMEYSTKVKFERILNAYSIFDSDMGYCQGLQFIVAPLLFHFQNELKTFNSLVKLFEFNKLRNIYDNDMTDLNLWFYQFEKILSKELPDLKSHFELNQIDLKIFLSQWFLSFYSITIPFSFLIRTFDIMLLEGVKPTILRVGLVILKHNLKLLMSIDDTELIYQHLLSENCWGVFQNNVDEFINSLVNIPIGNFTVDSLQDLEDDYKNTTCSITKNESLIDKFLTSLSTLKNNSPVKAESIISREDSIKSSIFSNTNNSSLSILTTTESNQISNSKPNDLELIGEMYKLCIESGLNDPVLDRAKERLGF